MIERSFERLRVHYELEKKLASRLKNAPAKQRSELYTQVYDELFCTIYDHPQLTERGNSPVRARAIAQQIRLLERFISPNTVFMEIGAGDCAFSCTIASQVKKVYAVDVSPEITSNAQLPANAQLIIL
ncbi:hypothetical protein, partial [Methylicorpusculum sp.]|uniref:hypothetical protein n=1 Tax=Methylicorpusculum sp. TaxID=2713644 RepID=UPI002AC94FFA